tara:strand:- start:584 stop:709 length:126 start_codon:yes stop_codon:yes gene_type:complete
MKNGKLELKTLPTQDLIGYSNNNKIHNTKQIGLLAHSIKEY